MAAGSSGSALRALAALLLLCVAAAGRDFYNILGVDRGADEATIKKNYRNLAKKWHPDKNPGEEEKAEAKFREVCHTARLLPRALASGLSVFAFSTPRCLPRMRSCLTKRSAGSMTRCAGCGRTSRAHRGGASLEALFSLSKHCFALSTHTR
jgi:hypothetical protein